MQQIRKLWYSREDKAMPQNAAASPDCQEICGSETDDPGSDAERERTNDDTKAIETVAWMKMLGLIR